MTPPAAKSNTIGLSTGALFPEYHTEDALAVAADLGFRVVEVYIQTHGEYSPPFVAELKRRLDSFGITAHSVHNDVRHFELWSSYRRRAAESYALFERLIDLAAEVGAQAITWHGMRDNLDDPAAFDRFAESARSLGTRAQQAGITLTIENVSWCFLRRVEHIQRIRDANLPLGFTFDPFQAAEAGQHPSDIIRAMSDRLTTVHLSDFGDGEVRHLPLGAGIIDWPAVFRALADVDYAGPLIIETPVNGDTALIGAGRRFVERHLDARG